MSTSMTIEIAFFAVVVVVILIALSLVLINKRKQHRRVKADEIREQAKGEELQVNRRQALAEETAAKARAARADAEVKAAQAAGLEQEAAGHLREAKASRDRLDEHWERADGLDPASPAPETHKSADRS